MIHQQEPPGPQCSVDPEVTSVIHIRFFPLCSEMIAMGLSWAEELRAAIIPPELSYFLEQIG